MHILSFGFEATFKALITTKDVRVSSTLHRKQKIDFLTTPA